MSYKGSRLVVNSSAFFSDKKISFEISRLQDVTCNHKPLWFSTSEAEGLRHSSQEVLKAPKSETSACVFSYLLRSHVPVVHFFLEKSCRCLSFFF